MFKIYCDINNVYRPTIHKPLTDRWVNTFRKKEM